MVKSRAALGLLLILVSLPRPAGAGAFDSLAIGARANGMGGAFTAVADDPSAVYWNPAGLMNLRRPSVLLSHFDVQSLGLLSYDQLAFAQPFVYKNAVAVAWTRLGTTSNVTFLNYSENTFTLTYQQPLTPQISLGLNAKIFQVQYDETASGFGIDLGGRYQILPELAVALMWENANQPQIAWLTRNVDNLPYNLRLGVAGYPTPDITVAVDADHLLDAARAAHVGTELWFLDKVLALRAGITYQMDGGHLMPAAGLGFRFSFLELAYAYSSHFDFDGNHVFSLQWGF